MAMDGYTLKALVMELEEKVLHGRIEKIYQPRGNLLVLNIRTKSGRERLILSADPSAPRIHLTRETFMNPEHPPVFCMLLRKHIQNGTIDLLQQQGMDRIIEIGVKVYDELGILSTRYLVCEIMGRHSNIILLDQERNVIDAVKRITEDISSFRHIIPKVPYKTPPRQNKINILDADAGLLKEGIAMQQNKKAEKALIGSLEGISPSIAREICYRSGVDPDLPVNEHYAAALADTVLDFKHILSERRFNPAIYYKGDKVMEFSPVALRHLQLPSRPQDSINSMVDSFFSMRINAARLNQAKDVLLKALKSIHQRSGRKLLLQQEEYQKAADYEEYRLYGELLTANLFRIKENSDRVVLENFFVPGADPVEIPLNPHLSASENAQRFFKIYNKKKRVVQNLSEQIRKTEDEKKYIESLMFNIENSTSYDEIAETREELVKGGYLRPAGKKDRDKTSPRSQPLHFLSSDGFHIYVGKNNYQNDYLTLKFASKDDLWLHTKDIPGSHVIIRSEGREVPDTTIGEAALLAAYHSKGRYSANVPVDYTCVKHVSKPSGARPGMVIYREHKTLFATPDEHLVNEIMKRKQL